MTTKQPDIGGISLGSTVDNPLTLWTPVDDAQKKAFAGVGALCLVLVLGSSVFKALTSRRTGEKTNGQDLSFGGSLVLFIAFFGSSIAMFCFGDAKNIMAYADSSVASTAFYTAALVCIRIAFLCLFQDMLFRRTQYWRFSIFLAAGFSSYSILFILINAFQCKPMHPILEEGRCINIEALEISFGIIDFLVNIVVLAIPAKALWQGRAHPDLKNRWCYPIAYVLGIVACLLGLIHAVAPAASVATWSLLYPMMGLLSLTLMFLSFAVTMVPSFVRSKAGPIQSPTTTHPHLQARSTSVLSWLPGHKNPNLDDSSYHNDSRGDSTDDNNSIKELPGDDVEKSTESVNNSSEALPVTSPIPKPTPLDDLDGRTLDGRTNSLRSFSRLGSLTGAVKPPSFLANRAGRKDANRHERPNDLDVNGISVTTEVEMSYEERLRRKSRNQSPNRSPTTAERKTEPST